MRRVNHFPVTCAYQDLAMNTWLNIGETFNRFTAPFSTGAVGFATLSVWVMMRFSFWWS
jgi:hypothetical protein